MRSKHLTSAPKACLVYLKAAQKMLSYSLSWGMKKYDKYMKEYFILLSVNQKEPTATEQIWIVSNLITMLCCFIM